MLRVIVYYTAVCTNCIDGAVGEFFFQQQNTRRQSLILSDLITGTFEAFLMAVREWPTASPYFVLPLFFSKWSIYIRQTCTACTIDQHKSIPMRKCTENSMAQIYKKNKAPRSRFFSSSLDFERRANLLNAHGEKEKITHNNPSSSKWDN